MPGPVLRASFQSTPLADMTKQDWKRSKPCKMERQRHFIKLSDTTKLKRRQKIKRQKTGDRGVI